MKGARWRARIGASGVREPEVSLRFFLGARSRLMEILRIWRSRTTSRLAESRHVRRHRRYIMSSSAACARRNLYHDIAINCSKIHVMRWKRKKKEKRVLQLDLHSPKHDAVVRDLLPPVQHRRKRLSDKSQRVYHVFNRKSAKLRRRHTYLTRIRNRRELGKVRISFLGF